MKIIDFLKYNIVIKRVFPVLSILTIAFSISKAQNYNFPDIYSEKILVNPAYSGLSDYSEINLNFSVNFFNNLYSASYNQYFENLHSGIGIMAVNNRLGKGSINELNFSFIYSYKIKLNYKSIINTALQIGYFEQSVNSEKLIFSNQIDPVTNIINPNTSEFFNKTFRTYRFSFGTTYISNKYRTGFSIQNIDKLVYNNTDNIITPVYTAYFGKVFSVNLYNQNNKLLLTPEIIWQSQNNFHQLIYAVHGIYNIFLTRFFLKQNLKFNIFESGITIGLNYIKFRFTYTYNIAFTKYISLPFSSNQITLRYNLGKQKKINIKNTIYCSNF